MTPRALLPALLRRRDGVTAVEFALVSPVLLLLIMGMIELGYYAYTEVELHGVITKAARDSTLGSAQGNIAPIDDRVTDAFHQISPEAVLSFSRKAYNSYREVGRPEDYADANHNGQYDPGECFVDTNNNGQWDADRGENGQGGGNQIVNYSVTATYHRLFPMLNLFGGDAVSVTATTQLMNQPFGLIAPKVLCS